MGAAAVPFHPSPIPVSRVACGHASTNEGAMSYKHVMFRSAAREKVLRGATQLADAVRVTLGPKSKSVLI